MAKRRYAVEISNINEDPRLFVDRNEIMKLTKVAKSWEFTCSFCFKKFPSAQAMGGHQNAHRSERLEEKRLFVRDPIGYRKRAYLRAMKADKSAAPAAVEEKNPTPINHHQLHAPRKMATVKKESANMNEALSKKNILAEGRGLGTKNCFCKGSSSKDPNASSVTEIRNKNDVKKIPLVVMNFFPPKELSLAESVGVINGGDAKGKAAACVREFDINCGYNGINLDHQNLDLTLKL